MTNTERCINPDHDHELEANDEPGLCNDCRQPTHFDKGTGWYHHTDPDDPVCFLTTSPWARGKTPCQY